VICLTRLNGDQFYINAEHIQTVQSTPDTHIVLTNGQQFLVREPADRVSDLMISYQQRVRRAGFGLVEPPAPPTG
jgi:flagellar protein FlbD